MVERERERERESERESEREREREKEREKNKIVFFQGYVTVGEKEVLLANE